MKWISCRLAVGVDVPTHEEYERQIANLRGRVERLRAESTYLNGVLRRKALELDALGRVWCSGGCRTGMYAHSPDDVTEDQVRFLERNAQRARRHYNARQCWTRRGQTKLCSGCRSEYICRGEADKVSAVSEGE